MFGIISAGIGAICGVVGSCAAAIGSIGSAVVSGVKMLAGGVVNILGKIPEIKIEDVFKTIHEIANVVNVVSGLVGVQNEDSPAELGAKVQQADKKIEDFDNDVEAYIRYLNDEIQLDKEKFEQMKPEEKAACEAVGMALETKAVEKKLDVEITPECLATLGKLHLAGVEIDVKGLLKVIEGLKEVGITNMNDVADYLTGKNGSNRIKTGMELEKIMGENADVKLDMMKEAVRQKEEI